MLYANGCSLSAVTDAPGRTWPVILGELLNLPSRNDSYPGGSNDRIWRKTLEWISQSPPSGRIALLQWTQPTRREFYSEASLPGREGHWIRCKANSSTFLPNWFEKRFCGLYEVYFMHDEESIIRAGNQILTIQSILNQAGVKYVFLDYRILFDRTSIQASPTAKLIDWTKWISLDGVVPEQDWIEPGHLRESGHSLVAEYIRYDLLRRGLINA